MSIPDVTTALESLGPRIRELRRRRNVSLTSLGESTGISVSTLSRLEAGQRKATLELLLPISAALRVSLDELTGALQGDPRVRQKPRKVGGVRTVNLTHEDSALKVAHMTFPRASSRPELRTHPGYDWVFVLRGELRLVLGERDLTMGAGETAEFDTTTPHWMGSTGRGPVEVLAIFGPQGESVHLNAKAHKHG